MFTINFKCQGENISIKNNKTYNFHSLKGILGVRNWEANRIKFF
jgi:hypothetical protein